jgi:DNA-binding GntR family transcriptional regulator
VDDQQPVQIHVSWLPGLPGQAGAVIRGIDPGASWPEAVQEITGRPVAAVRQLSRARRANPFEARTFGLPDGTVVFVSHLTTYDTGHRPVEHSRYTWPTDAVRVSDDYPYPGGSARD